MSPERFHPAKGASPAATGFADAAPAPASRRTCLAWALALAAAAGGCASGHQGHTLDQARQAALALLQDGLFPRPSSLPDANAVLRPSEAMRAYAERALSRTRDRDPRAALLHALATSELRLEYDSGRTRDAAETFAERSGNCLSLVLMTASLAKLLDLPVTYQAVVMDEAATREGDYLFLSSHVNLLLGPRALSRQTWDDRTLVVDFLPPQQVAHYRTLALEQAQVVAMYMNNRAAEVLAAGDVRAAYWWVREGLHSDPLSSSVLNTLGVVYSRAGHARPAEQAWRRALELAPDSTSVLANLVQQLRSQGRQAESAPLEARLAQLQPVPPLHWFKLGRAAYERGEYETARTLFLRELRRQPYQAEVHFWLAATHAQLGQAERAARDLAQAVSHSTTLAQQQLYAGKLARLRGQLPELR